MRTRRPAPVRKAALCLVGLLAACINVNTQRWPGPMDAEVHPLPPGDSGLHPIGPEEVTVVRHADPVRVRPAGATSGRPLSFYDRQARLTAGAQVVVAPGGRAEVLWPEGASVILFGRAVGWIGSPSRGEPIFDLRDVERARVMLRQGDLVRLVGGALLSGEAGPYLLTRDEAGTLAVHNQSEGAMAVAFRNELFELGPGQQVVLPLLSTGGAPFDTPAGVQRLVGPGFNLDVLGKVEPVDRDGGLLLRAQDASEVTGLGVKVRLGPGAEATFSDLGNRAEEAPRAPDPSATEALPVSEDPPAVEVREDSGGG